MILLIMSLQQELSFMKKLAFDNKEGCTVTFSLELKERAEEVGWNTRLGVV